MEVQKGRKDPSKKNIGLYISRLNDSAVAQTVSRLSKALEDDYNVYVIVDRARDAQISVSGTLVDMSRGTMALGLKLTKSSVQLNSLIMNYELDAVLSFSQQANLINGLYNHTCKSALCMKLRQPGGTSRTLQQRAFERQMKTACRNGDVIVAFSERQKIRIADEMGVPTSKILVLGDLTGGAEDQEMIRGYKTMIGQLLK